MPDKNGGKHDDKPISKPVSKPVNCALFFCRNPRLDSRWTIDGFICAYPEGTTIEDVQTWHPDLTVQQLQPGWGSLTTPGLFAIQVDVSTTAAVVSYGGVPTP